MSLLFGLFASSTVHSENLIKEPSDKGLFTVLPVRINNSTIGGFEVKDIKIYKNGALVRGYGFKIEKAGHEFKFDKSLISMFYLRSTADSFSESKPTAEWGCNPEYFEAVVDGQKEGVYKEYPGLSSYYPKGTSFTVKYISTIEVLGKKATQEKMRPIEVWGLANSKKNADKMVKYYESHMIESTYYFLTASPHGFHKKSSLLNDSVTVKFSAHSVEIKPDKGNILTGVRNVFNALTEATRSNNYGTANIFMDLSVNGNTATWKSQIREYDRRIWDGTLRWFWSDPGFHTVHLDGRHVVVYARSQDKGSSIWVQYKGSSSSGNLDIANVRIPKCE